MPLDGRDRSESPTSAQRICGTPRRRRLPERGIDAAQVVRADRGPASLGAQSAARDGGTAALFSTLVAPRRVPRKSVCHVGRYVTIQLVRAAESPAALVVDNRASSTGDVLIVTGARAHGRDTCRLLDTQDPWNVDLVSVPSEREQSTSSRRSARPGLSSGETTIALYQKAPCVGSSGESRLTR